jgi:hypothetical protein
MAKTTIEIDVNTGDSAKSLADLRNEFKDIQKELSGLTPGTEKYVDALKKLGAVKDEIGDLKDQIQGFAGADKKISAVTNVVGGLASGFQAAQGAAAIFGSESENLEKTLLRIQAVMAFTQGIQGIASLGDSLSVLVNVIKSTELGAKAAAVAQRIWNLAIAANPIALIIAGLTALIGVIAVFVSSSEDETEAMKESIKQRERELELMNKTADALKSENKFRLDLAAAQGKSAAELAKLNEELSRNEIKNIDKRIKENKRLFDQRLVLMKNTSDEEFIDLQKANSETLAEMQRLANERLDIQRSLKIQEAKIETEANKASSEKTKEKAKEKKEDSNKEFEEALVEAERLSNIEIEKEKKLEEQRAALRKQMRDQEIAEQIKADEEYGKLLEEKAKKEEEAAKKAKEARQAEINANFKMTSDAIAALIALNNSYPATSEKNAKRSFQINKALQLAQATINGVQAVQNVLADPTLVGPARYVAAAIAGVTALANINKIAQTKFEPSSTSGGGGGGGNLGTFTQGGGGGQPPQGLTAQNTVTQLNPDGTVAGQGQRQAAPMKAYVVESESRAVTERVNKLSNNSKIG